MIEQTSQDVVEVRGDEVLHVGWFDEGLVNEVNDELADDCR